MKTNNCNKCSKHIDSYEIVHNHGTCDGCHYQNKKDGKVCEK